ncbi:MAG: CBS domain-containing protein [Clostridiales bacterium]|jgi:CBS domain-containing protein|nr:CBS domain-containing protein [Clostridiales bacterium]
MQVRQLMNTNVVSLLPDDSVSHAARLLQRHNVGSLPVCAQDGRLRGIVTDRDIVLRCVASESPPEETRVREIMTRGVVSVTPDDDVREAAHLMAAEQIRRLPVVENNRVIGMLSIADMARNHAFDMETSKALSEISMPDNPYNKK